MRIRYATQVGVKPPTFLCFATAGNRLHFSYLRYLENSLREAYGFRGTPIRLAVRGRGHSVVMPEITNILKIGKWSELGKKYQASQDISKLVRRSS